MAALKGIDHEESWMRALIQWASPKPNSLDRDDMKAKKLSELKRPYTQKEKIFLLRYIYNPSLGFFAVKDIKAKLNKKISSMIISKMSRMVGTVKNKEGMLIRKGWVRRYEPKQELRLNNTKYFYRLNSTPKAFKEIILFFYDRGLLDEVMRSRYVNVSLWSDDIYDMLVDFHICLFGGYVKKEQITNTIEDKVKLIYEWFGVNIIPKNQTDEPIDKFGEFNYCLRYLFVEYLKDEGRFRERMQKIKEKVEMKFGSRAIKIFSMLIISHAIINSDFSKTSNQLDIIDNLTQTLRTMEV